METSLEFGVNKSLNVNKSYHPDVNNSDQPQQFNADESLETKTRRSLHVIGISPEVQEIVFSLLAPLREKSSITHYHYNHSLRVGLICKGIADYCRLDPKPLTLAGLLHDLGKVQTNPATLGKTSGWTPADTEEMKCHVIDSYRILRGRLDFTAEIVVAHHYYQKNGYPSELPPPLHEYSKATRILINYLARMLSLADCYDALHRVNDKFGETRGLTPDEIQSKMMDMNPDQKYLITCLYEGGLFGKEKTAAKAHQD